MFLLIARKKGLKYLYLVEEKIYTFLIKKSDLKFTFFFFCTSNKIN